MAITIGENLVEIRGMCFLSGVSETPIILSGDLSGGTGIPKFFSDGSTDVEIPPFWKGGSIEVRVQENVFISYAKFGKLRRWLMWKVLLGWRG